MEGKLPANIIHRPKKGFGIPLSDWIRKDLRKRIDEVLLDEDHYFNMNFIEKMLQEHHAGKQNHRKLIWNLYVAKRFISDHQY
jgi:asparagine synthase (glutamine-hydrolysing)